MDEGPEHISAALHAPFLDKGAFSITSWNVNSVKARLPLVLSYLETYSPDILLLQEIKTETNTFPEFEISAAGYKSIAVGQKSYNGVAVLSKQPLRLISDRLPDAPDNAEQARFIDAKDETTGIHFISAYVPNGQPPANDPDSTHKIEYKIKWMNALNCFLSKMLKKDIPFVLGGDFNVIEKNEDVYDIRPFENGPFTLPAVREQFRMIGFSGMTNALRVKSFRSPLYSYWDYQAGAWQKNDGILLDHIFLSPALADRLDQADVNSEYRGKEKASDHAPIWCSFV